MTEKLKRMPGVHLRLVARINGIPSRWYHWLPLVGVELLRRDVDRAQAYHRREYIAAEDIRRGQAVMVDETGLARPARVRWPS